MTVSRSWISFALCEVKGVELRVFRGLSIEEACGETVGWPKQRSRELEKPKVNARYLPRL